MLGILGAALAASSIHPRDRNADEHARHHHRADDGPDVTRVRCEPEQVEPPPERELTEVIRVPRISPQAGLDDAVKRSNMKLREFEKVYK